MTKKAASSSSSSSEEDLAAFRSVAVSFEEITSKQKEIAEQAKQYISGSSKRRRKCGSKFAIGRGEDGATPQDNDDKDDDGPMGQLDHFQLKVAAALDSVLAERLRIKTPGPKKLHRELRAAGRAAEEVAAGEVGRGAFRFFARVPHGQSVVLQATEQPPNPGKPFPQQFQDRRAPSAEAAAWALTALVVDGAQLISAAGAAAEAEETRAAVRVPEPAHILLQELEQKGKKKKKGKKASSAQEQRGGEGVVIDPRVFVPYDDRMKRLLGNVTGPRLAVER